MMKCKFCNDCVDSFHFATSTYKHYYCPNCGAHYYDAEGHSFWRSKYNNKKWWTKKEWFKEIGKELSDE